MREPELSGRELEEKLQEMSKTFACAECDAPLITPWDRETSQIILVCGQDRSHKGYRRIKSLGEEMDEGAELPLYIKDNIVKRRKKEMTEEYGPERGGALEPYRAITSLSKAQASLVLSTIWPEAPLVEVTKAAMLCASYGLNPLMRHVFLIPFKNKRTGGKDWAIVLGIKAKRLMASRRCGYGYVDGPRIMTRQEQESILGEEDDKKLWSLTRLKNKDGLEAVGYGNWPKSEEPYGVEKGNSKANMAHIRSESAALDRLNPAEMPFEVEVMDEQFIEAEFKVVDEKTGEIKDVPGVRIIEDEEVVEASRFDDLLIACPIHGDPWKLDKFNKLQHSHEGGWCKASPIFFELFAKEAKRVGFVSEPDEKWKLDDYLKARFGGRTWSKMSPTEQVNACKLMERTEQKPESAPPAPPVAVEDEPPVDIEPTEAPF